MTNKYMPGNYINKVKERLEEEQIRTILPKYRLLRESGITNSGNLTAILVSSTNGSGEYNSQHHMYHLSAGLKYKHLFGENSVLFDSATSEDLEMVILNTSFRNIMVIGHASYHSWRASDKLVDWFNIGQMVGRHLKNGIFANLGCGGIDSWKMIPLGYFVVLDHNKLIGYEAEHVSLKKLGDLSKLKFLKLMPRIDLGD